MRSRGRRPYRTLQPGGPGIMIRWVGLSLVAAACLFPFYAMVVLSLKPNTTIELPGALWPFSGISLDSYRQVLSDQDLPIWLLNTLVYSLVSVAAVLFVSSLAGYAFAKKRFPGRETIFWSFLSMLMVPFHVTLIPTFMLIAGLKGVNTYWGLILPTLANTQAVFLMRQFIRGLPDELFEAARVDGASEFMVFWRIVLPLCRPVLATLGIFVFLWHWNDFLWPLVVGRRSEMWTLTVGIASLQRQDVPLSVMFAGSTVALLPIFLAYLVAQRYGQEGYVNSGFKG